MSLFPFTSNYLSIPTGSPGTVVTTLPQVIEGAFLDNVNNTPTYISQPVTMVAGKLQYMTTAVAADFFGILTRLAPRIGGSLNSTFNFMTPDARYEQGVLKRAG